MHVSLTSSAGQCTKPEQVFVAILCLFRPSDNYLCTLNTDFKKNQQQPPYRCFHGGLSSAHGSIGVNSRLTLKSFPSLGYEVTGLNTNRGHRAGRLGTRRTTVKWVIEKNCVNNCWRKRLQEDNRGWCIASCSFMMVPYYWQESWVF